jgi:hypothetical protein
MATRQRAKAPNTTETGACGTGLWPRRNPAPRDLPPCISPTIGPQRRRIGSLAAPLEREQGCKDARQGDTSGEEEPVHRLEPKQHPTRHSTDSSTVSFAALTYSSAIVKKMCLTVTNTRGERAVPTRLRQPL